MSEKTADRSTTKVDTKPAVASTVSPTLSSAYPAAEQTAILGTLPTSSDSVLARLNRRPTEQSVYAIPRILAKVSVAAHSAIAVYSNLVEIYPALTLPLSNRLTIATNTP